VILRHASAWRVLCLHIQAGSPTLNAPRLIPLREDNAGWSLRATLMLHRVEEKGMPRLLLRIVSLLMVLKSMALGE